MKTQTQSGRASGSSRSPTLPLARKLVTRLQETGAVPVLLGITLVFSTLDPNRTPAFAQAYSIDWQTIDGGGSTSTGGVYSVSGTIGQPDAGGPMTNGQYSVTGGFWALPTAVQTVGAPKLTIVPAGAGLVTISWVPVSTNWVLQENLNLGTTNWTYSLSGSTNPIAVPATLPTKFYRLFEFMP